MKKLRFLIILLAALSIAGSAVALDRGGATARAFDLAKWKAACGQGYWNCTTIVVEYCVPTGQNRKGVDQWDCSVHVVRTHNKTAQWCHVAVGLDPYGATEYLTISCGAPPSRDVARKEVRSYRYHPAVSDT